MLAIVLVLLGLIFLTRPVFAGEPPIQISPTNGSVVSSSTLNWQTPSYDLNSSNPYRIQVDDNSSFPSSSINKDYYTKNTTYTPVLNTGIWYWRVKAKDSSDIWSSWSNVWSFTLQSNSTPNPTPTPTPSPTSTPAPTPSSSYSSSFTISNIPSQINSDQSFSVSISLLLPNNPNERFYLKGAFRHPDKPANYFGLTKVSESWIKNISAYSNQFPITTNSSGNWSGALEVKPDINDSGFIGSGNYLFKVGRYQDAENSSVSWSNEHNIEIAQATGTTEVESTYSNPQPSTNPTKSPSTSQTKSVITKISSVPKIDHQIASIAAATSLPTLTPKTEIKNQKQTNPFIWGGIILVLAGAGCLGYVYLKRNKV